MRAVLHGVDCAAELRDGRDSGLGQLRLVPRKDRLVRYARVQRTAKRCVVLVAFPDSQADRSFRIVLPAPSPAARLAARHFRVERRVAGVDDPVDPLPGY